MDIKTKEDLLLDYYEKNELVPLVRFQSLARFSTATRARWALSGRIPSLKIAGKFLTHPTFVNEFLRSLCTTGNKSPGTSKTDPEEAHGRDIDHISSMVKLRKRGIVKPR